MNSYKIQLLPPKINLETIPILKKTAQTHRYLAELKGISKTIPNETILINTLTLQEAKDSSAVENIITTHDDLFKEELFSDYITNVAAKEVRNYTFALKKGFDLVKKSDFLTNNHILTIQSELEKNNAGFRKLPGTELKNDKTGETVYVPPQDPQDILNLMSNLEKYINDDSISTLDPLIKMTIIHFQFESIHPFYDGNGRCGRIINILYLVLKKLLDIPVLHLSRYIISNKNSYYSLLQKVRDQNAWEEWILYMLDGVEKTSIQTIKIIQEMHKIMLNYKHRIRNQFSFYSQDLLNNLFFHPYTKIEFLQHDIKVTRKTASKYLDMLTTQGFLKKKKIGNNNYYINIPLFNLLLNVDKLA